MKNSIVTMNMNNAQDAHHAPINSLIVFMLIRVSSRSGPLYWRQDIHWFWKNVCSPGIRCARKGEKDAQLSAPGALFHLSAPVSPVQICPIIKKRHAAGGPTVSGWRHW